MLSILNGLNKDIDIVEPVSILAELLYSLKNIVASTVKSINLSSFDLLLESVISLSTFFDGS